MSETYPTYEEYQPPTPLFNTGIAQVTGSDGETVYDVDLSAGVCSCQHGKAWAFSRGKWVPNNFCFHKLKVVASLIEASEHPDDTREMQTIYNQLLGKRYIVWESISAFHKELRRRDPNAALYWLLSVSAHRGLWGAVSYMHNILFEESRDVDLYNHLMDLRERGRKVTYQEVIHAVRWFCAAPKKWELDGRLDIFIGEMSGYRTLVTDFGTAVARGKDIILSSFHEELKTDLYEGFASGDQARMQRGLKGLYKSLYEGGHDALKAVILSYLTDIHKNNRSAFAHDPAYTETVYRRVYRRHVTFRDIGYHDLNALADALSGEYYAHSEHLTPRATLRRIFLNTKLYAPPLGITKQIPLYAQDNHTYRGKALMGKWGPTQLAPGADQTDIDFRWCGAYCGVAWRYLAYKQHNTCEVAWGDVSWRSPKWLWQHVERMFY